MGSNDPFPRNGPPDRYEFWRDVVDPIPGWLHKAAAIHTMDLLECQELFGVQGSLLEIGVHSGRYFSILVRHARRANSIALGIDTFQLVDVEVARRHVAAAAGEADVFNFLHAYSVDMDPKRTLALLGTAPRFISVDGSHEKPDVFHDLGLAEAIIAPGGIVAVDDFLNYVTPGVNEAVFEFYATPRRLVPFAFISNKLFFTFRHWADRYKSMLENKLMNDDVSDHSRFFRHRLAEARSLVEGRLWGSALLLVP